MSFADTTVKWSQVGITEDGRVKLQNNYDGKYRYVQNGTLYNNGTAVVEARINAEVNSVNTGAKSANTVSGKVVTKTTKGDIIRGVMNNAVKGAKWAGDKAVRGRGNMYGIALTLLLDAINKDPKTGKSFPENQGFEFDGGNGFGRFEGQIAGCIINQSGYNGSVLLNTSIDECSNGKKILINSYSNSESQNKEYLSGARHLCNMSLATSIAIKDYTISRFYIDNQVKSGGLGSAHVACYFDIRSNKTGIEIKRYFYGNVYFGRAKYVPFLGDISDAEFEKNLDKWIEAARDEEGNIPNSSTTVVIDNGQVAQTPPYTDKNGRAVQTRWDFETSPTPDGTGKTSVRETTIPRPDLTPDSPEAPRLKTPPSGDPNGSTAKPPSSSSGSIPDNSSPTGTPSDKDGNGDKDKDKDSDKKDKDRDGTKDDEKDKKQPEVQGLCDQYPDILACDKQPEKEIEEAELPEIPSEEISLVFTPDNVFPVTGTCPEPVQFAAFGKTFAFSLQPVCDVAKMLRPVIIAFAWLVAAFFVVKTIRSET